MTLDEETRQAVQRGKRFWDSLEYQQRLDLLCYITAVLHDHMQNPGTYRYLIYNRFGFQPEAYALLQVAGLLDVHNALWEEGARQRRLIRKCREKWRQEDDVQDNS